VPQTTVDKINEMARLSRWKIFWQELISERIILVFGFTSLLLTGSTA